MKRIFVFLLLLLLLLPVVQHADVAWTPLDPFQQQNPDPDLYDWFPEAHRYYVALCDFHSYVSPETPMRHTAISKGSALHIKYGYTDEFGHNWGLASDNMGWVPMDAVSLTYGAKDYDSDHRSSTLPYAGQIDHLLAAQEEIDRYVHWLSAPAGPDNLRPDIDSGYTAWHYPNAPWSYENIPSVAIIPIRTLTDAAGTTWVYAQHRAIPDHTVWINADAPNARPDPASPALLPHTFEAPTHLPVPGKKLLYRRGILTFLAPVLPVIAAVFTVMLLSAALLVLLRRKKVT